MRSAISIVFALTVLTGCATPFSFPTAPSGERLVKDYKDSRSGVEEPVLVGVDPQTGKTVVAYRRERVDSIGLVDTQPKRSIFSRVWGTFGFWTILIVLACVFIPGFATVLGMILARFRKG